MIVAALDIETTGLCKESCLITVVAIVLYDTDDARVVDSKSFNVCLAREKSTEDEDLVKAQVRDMMDTSDKLLAYNGKSFDIPWIHYWACASDENTLQRWNQKLIDFCHEGISRIQSFISMQKVCDDNAIGVAKTATGKQAIVWANEREWKLLVRAVALRLCTCLETNLAVMCLQEEYCMADVHVLLEIFKLCLTHGIVLRSKSMRRQGVVQDRIKEVRIFIDRGMNVTSDTPPIALPERVEHAPAAKQMHVVISKADVDDIFA